MRLSKQERIAAIVVLVLVILVAGVFLFIKPNIETIMATRETLSIKEREYNDAVNKVATKGQLREDILTAYDKGKNMADMFFPELADYQADFELQEFLATSKANVLIETLEEITPPATAGLSATLYVPANVQYALKEYVNQGNSNEITDPALIRQAQIAAALGEPQTIGATTVTFTVQALEPAELLKFADEVNRYQKSENGKSIRKAMELNGIEIVDEKLNNAYKKRAEEIIASAGPTAAKLFQEKTGYILSDYIEPDEDPMGAGTPEEAGVTEYVYKMTCSLTFYSIERMQDPTSVLDEQDRTA